MPPRKSKKNPSPAHPSGGQERAYIENAGVVLPQPITQTIEKNYMPYAMSVILSRAIPEIDGFKPSHRKLLYTMYKMGLLSGARTKSANIVGQTMRLNPHGDQAIYDTMVRLSKGYQALLHPFVDSKGNFGRAYSRDMACAAPRYTEAKLSPICAELFDEIDKDTVDMVDNYDGTMKEPTLLPVTFPTILVNANMGIAVGMASSICPFNLREVCLTAAALLKNPEHRLMDTLSGPDFPGGGLLLFDEAELEKIYQTGRGSLRLRARYRVDKEAGCIEITEIPPSTTVEAIMDKIVELVKSGRVREVADVRDETDLNGLKLAIDLKRGVDGDRLMQRLYKLTPLEDSFSCNFNVLIGGSPRVLGVGQLLEEWIAFRREAIRRRVYFDLHKKQEKLHLLQGLAAILLDIDKAVRIVRETEEEREVVPNLMIGFGIDQVQAEYVAEIRLRHLNREYILNRTQETEQLAADIADMQQTLADPARVSRMMAEQLKAVAKQYGQERKTQILYQVEDLPDEGEEAPPSYPVHLFFTREGYFKKITPQSLRMSGEHKLKEGDAITQQLQSGNGAELLFFTNRGQVYKSRCADFEDTKASALGDYLPAKLGMEEGEAPLYLAVTADYRGQMVFAFESGRIARVEMSAYQTKTRRKKLTGAFCLKEPLVDMLYLPEGGELQLVSTSGRILVVDCASLSLKSTRDTMGVQVMTQKKGARLERMLAYHAGGLEGDHRYRTRSLPAAGAYPPKGAPASGQLSF